MKKTMQKISELSDHKWIKEKWKPKQGDWYIEIQPYENLKRLKSIWIYGKQELQQRYKNIYLPIGFNPETCNLQIDDLLMEILKLNYREMEIDFIYWFEGYDGDIDQNNLILKLIWLRELIEEIERGN